MTPAQKRKALRREAKERQRTVLPRLRKRVTELKRKRAKRLKRCQSEALKARAVNMRRAESARDKLRARIALLRERLKDAARACKASARERTARELEKALDLVVQEREYITSLRRQAAALKSSKGRAGGLRAQELRAESDEEVLRNLPDDPVWRETWLTLRRKIAATPRMTRTEAFLEHIHKHPHILDEVRHKQEQRYEREAEELFANLQRCADDPNGCPVEWLEHLDRTEAHLEEVPF